MPVGIAAKVAVFPLTVVVPNTVPVLEPSLSVTVPPFGLVAPLPVTLATKFSEVPNANEPVPPVMLTVGVICATTAFCGGVESESAEATLPFVALPLNRAIIEYDPRRTSKDG